MSGRMRAYVLTGVLAVFASCETQELELVPAEVARPGENDAGSGGVRGGREGGAIDRTGGDPGMGNEAGGMQGAGGGPTESGGNWGQGGKGNGARPPNGDGGAAGAGGGPGKGGSGTGGFAGPGPDCRVNGCPTGQHCSLAGRCVECLEKEHCADPSQTCDPVLNQCSQFCGSPADCAPPETECDPARHVCVECVDSAVCAAKYRTRRICAPIIATCVQCGTNVDCGPQGKCLYPQLRCACTDDAGCEETERCNDLHQCVLKQN